MPRAAKKPKGHVVKTPDIAQGIKTMEDTVKDKRNKTDAGKEKQKAGGQDGQTGRMKKKRITQRTPEEDTKRSLVMQEPQNGNSACFDQLTVYQAQVEDLGPCHIGTASY